MIKEELKEVREKAESMQKESTLATTLLHELKMSARRWFIISIILLIALVGSNIGWLIYESQWEIVEEKNQEANSTDNSSIIQTIN